MPIQDELSRRNQVIDRLHVEIRELKECNRNLSASVDMWHKRWRKEYDLCATANMSRDKTKREFETFEKLYTIIHDKCVEEQKLRLIIETRLTALDNTTQELSDRLSMAQSLLRDAIKERDAAIVDNPFVHQNVSNIPPTKVIRCIKCDWPMTSVCRISDEQNMLEWNEYGCTHCNHTCKGSPRRSTFDSKNAICKHTFNNVGCKHTHTIFVDTDSLQDIMPGVVSMTKCTACGAILEREFCDDVSHFEHARKTIAGWPEWKQNINPTQTAKCAACGDKIPDCVYCDELPICKLCNGDVDNCYYNFCNEFSSTIGVRLKGVKDVEKD